MCIKKMLFLGKSAYFQQKLEIFAQWPSKIVLNFVELAQADNPLEGTLPGMV